VVVAVVTFFGVRALLTPSDVAEEEAAVQQILGDNPDALLNGDGTITLADGTVVDPGAATANAGSGSNAGSGPGATANDGSTAGGGSNAGNGGGNTGTGGSSTGGGGQVWHDGYNEQVWVDTSHWESTVLRPAYDEPVMELHEFCWGCGADITGQIMQHMDWHLATDGTDYGWYDKYVQVDTIHHDAITQDTWVSGGYWTTVWHDGYWG